AIEGYVDARRLSSDRCLGFAHLVDAREDAVVTYELAPSGPATLFLDGAWVATAPPVNAVLGQGATLPLRLRKGAPGLFVATCPAGELNGFYLVERARTAPDAPLIPRPEPSR